MMSTLTEPLQRFTDLMTSLEMQENRVNSNLGTADKVIDQWKSRTAGDYGSTLRAEISQLLHNINLNIEKMRKDVHSIKSDKVVALLTQKGGLSIKEAQARELGNIVAWIETLLDLQDQALDLQNKFGLQSIESEEEKSAIDPAIFKNVDELYVYWDRQAFLTHTALQESQNWSHHWLPLLTSVKSKTQALKQLKRALVVIEGRVKDMKSVVERLEEGEGVESRKKLIELFQSQYVDWSMSDQMAGQYLAKMKRMLGYYDQVVEEMTVALEKAEVSKADLI
jgi:uncharacterized protein YdiU (UPF0061 family)